MWQPWGFVAWVGTLGTERTDEDLGENGANLSGGGGDTVRGGSVASWEAFSWNNEGGGVGAKVEKELTKNVKREKATLGDGVESGTDDEEENGENDESHELDGLTTNGIDSSDGDPVSGDGTSTDEDDVSDSVVAEGLVDVWMLRVTDLFEDDGVVQTQSIKSNVEKEPRTSGTEKDLAILPGGVVSEEIGPRSLWNCDLLLSSGDSIGDNLGLIDAGVINLCLFLINVIDIELVARSFRHGETIVKRNTARNSTKTNDNSPHSVDSSLAGNVTQLGGMSIDSLGLESLSDNQSTNGSSELANTLHGENTTHHSASPLGVGVSRKAVSS